MLKALLIGQNPLGASSFLRERGCEIRHATSYQEAWEILDAGHLDFDLVLSPIRINKASGLDLAELLEGSGVTLFYSYVVEQGTWWMPAVREGRKCFGTAALRDSEFSAFLEKTIYAVRISRQLRRASLFDMDRKAAGE